MPTRGASTDTLTALAAELRTATGAVVREGVSGSALTTFAIGGPLRFLIEAGSTEQLGAIIRFLREHGQSWRTIGNGSNLLISDAGVDGWVLTLGPAFRFIRPLEGGCFEVGAKTALMSLSRDLSARGFSGLEFAGGIPGVLGGGVVMNAGAHRGQLADIVREITLIDAEGYERRVCASDCRFAYRRSELPAGSVVVSARIALTPGDPERSAELRARLLTERKRTQPLTLPSAGSIFKNPSADSPAGRLLDEAGLKSTRVGGAEVSALHANWIVNPARTASSADVLSLIALCKARVREQHGCELAPELVVWGAAEPPES